MPMRFKGRTESIPDLANGVVEDAQRLVHLEIELAKIELKEMALRNGAAAGLFGGALTLAVLALLVAVPVLIVVAVPWHWQAALVWIVLYILGAAVMALVGRKLLKLKPERTVQSINETKEWFSDLTSSLGR